jgi:hypothetical protein
LLVSAFLHGFGPDGTEAVGRVADAFLTEQAREYFQVFLGEKHLNQVATWADVTKRPQYTHKWHYAAIPLSDSAFQTEKYATDDNLLMSLPNFIMVLRHSATSLSEKTESIKWIINLVTDIHQPVNIACLNDSVGRETAVEYAGKRYNLSSLWDEGLIKTHFKSNRILSHEIMRMMGIEADSSLFFNLEISDWVHETLKKARFCYQENGTPLQAGEVNKLSEVYGSSALYIIKSQLQRASLRLAHLLNNIASSEPAYGLFKFCWSTNSNIFHASSCPIASRILPKNIHFSNLVPGDRQPHASCKLLIQRLRPGGMRQGMGRQGSMENPQLDLGKENGATNFQL